MKIYLEQPLPSTDRFPIHDDFWSHYLTEVRRLSSGDELDVVGENRVARCRLVQTDPCGVQVLQVRDRRRAPYRLVLAQALTRKKKFEDVVRLGTEVGITDFRPLISRHTVRRPNNPEKQQRRWRRISLDSTRITERDWTPAIHPLEKLEKTLSVTEPTRTRFWGDPSGSPVRERVETGGEEAVIMVGPEGGFSDAEKDRLREWGEPLSLGEQNYRSETASLLLSTLWLHRSGYL